MTVRNSSGSWSAGCARRKIPALLTRPSIAPNVVDAPGDHSPAPSQVAMVPAAASGPAAGGRDLAATARGQVGVDVVDQHRRALGRGEPGVGGAEAPPGAGDDDRFAVEDAHQASRSMTMAMPWPPPTHMVSRPNCLSRGLQAVDQRGGDARAGHAERVADRDRAAVHVEPVQRRCRARAVRRDHLGGERLVDLDQVDVADGQPGAGQGRRDGLDRAEAHDLRAERRRRRWRRSGPAA